MLTARAFRTAAPGTVQAQRVKLPRGRAAMRVNAADWRSRSASPARGRESQSRTAPVPDWKLSPRQRQQKALQQINTGSSSSYGSSSAASESSWSAPSSYSSSSYSSSSRSATPSAGYRRESQSRAGLPLPPWKVSPRQRQSAPSSGYSAPASYSSNSNTSSWESTTSSTPSYNRSASESPARRRESQQRTAPVPDWKLSPRQRAQRVSSGGSSSSYTPSSSNGGSSWETSSTPSYSASASPQRRRESASREGAELPPWKMSPRQRANAARKY